MNRIRKRHLLIFLAIVVAAVSVLIFDLRIELGVAGGVPYVLVICVAYFGPSRRWIWIAAAVCIALTVYGYYISPAGGEPWKVLVNRCLAVFAIIVTATFADLAKQAIELVKANESQLQDRVDVQTKQIRDSQARLRGIIDNSRNFIGLLTTEGVLIDANQTALKSAGISSEDVLSKPFWETPWWSHSEESKARLKEAISEAGDGTGVSFETSHRTEEGVEIAIDFSLSPIINSNGDVIYLVPEGRDVTIRKRHAQALASKNEQLRRVNEELLQFAYSASHDLKAPLATMTGLLSFCLSDLENNQTREVQTNITESLAVAKQLSERIESMLSIAKTDMTDVEWDNVEIQSCLDEIWQTFSTDRVRLNTELKHRDPIRSVRTRLIVIIDNLLSNALKFMDPNRSDHEIRVNTRTEGSDFVLEVADNGIGIPENHIDKVFNLFHRTNSMSGTGIGLALVKKNAIQMGGDVSVESSPGHTVFTIRLPQNNDLQEQGV